MDSQTDDTEQQRRLIAALQDPALYGHAVRGFEVLETHISWVLLTGDFAYKLKKPLNLGFLDFSTLEKRRHCCEEELRLNRRTAPDLYQAIVPITGTPQSPALDGTGPVQEYAVKMVQFPHGALLNELLQAGRLAPEHIDALAHTVAGFHARAARVRADTPYGTPEAIWEPVEENFRQIRERVSETAILDALAAIEGWNRERLAALRDRFAQRREEGFVRECHGDLHLGNVALIDDRPTPFDCIEFNPNLRWIDVISEIAFLTMDLDDHSRGDLAARFLDGYMQVTGDYAGLELLRFYQCYRALVRAKVGAIRMGQAAGAPGEGQAVPEEVSAYIDLAARYTVRERPALLITHGLSGSGKTTASQPLMEAIGAVRLRSDIERKRLFGLSAESRTASGVGGGIYTSEATDATYARLAELSRGLLAAGFPVVVDATFLEAGRRQAFRMLAKELGVPFAILSFQASEAALRERVRQRERRGKDASEAGLAVLERQLIGQEPLQADEQRETIIIDTESSEGEGPALARLRTIAGLES